MADADDTGADKSIALHPLVILNICDHYTRVKLRADSGAPLPPDAADDDDDVSGAEALPRRRCRRTRDREAPPVDDAKEAITLGGCQVSILSPSSGIQYTLYIGIS